MTFEEYKSQWSITESKGREPIWYATPKNTIDPIGKRLSAGTRDTLEWLLEMNWKESTKDANLYVR